MGHTAPDRNPITFKFIHSDKAWLEYRLRQMAPKEDANQLLKGLPNTFDEWREMHWHEIAGRLKERAACPDEKTVMTAPNKPPGHVLGFKEAASRPRRYRLRATVWLIRRILAVLNRLSDWEIDSDVSSITVSLPSTIPRIGEMPDKCWFYCIFVAEKRYILPKVGILSQAVQRKALRACIYLAYRLMTLIVVAIG